MRVARFQHNVVVALCVAEMTVFSKPISAEEVAVEEALEERREKIEAGVKEYKENIKICEAGVAWLSLRDEKGINCPETMEKALEFIDLLPADEHDEGESAPATAAATKRVPDGEGLKDSAIWKAFAEIDLSRPEVKALADCLKKRKKKMKH